MESLISIECFVRSAEAGSFAAAARRLGLTPAAVSKNVARLENNLGVRLFQRSTRSLALTESGERFLDPEAACVAALMGLGVTLVSMPHAVPYLDSGRLVRVLPDWYVDAGNTALYYAAQKLLPAKTRVFVDYTIEHFRSQGLEHKFSAI